jgi:lysophospholipase L1-like esterase
VLNTQLAALSTSTNKVTITIGGNDAGFASVATTCTVGTDSDCYNAVNAAKAYINNQLPSRLDSTYAAIHQHSPSAQVVVISYPRLFDMTWWCYMGSNRRTWLNDGADLLASVTATRTNVAASRFGTNSFRFADSRPAFDAHGVCSSDAWLNGVAWPANESYHPTAPGHSYGFLPTVNAVTG